MSAASLRRRCWLWLPLAAFAACLNPQPDDNPMARQGDKAPSAATGAGNSGSADSLSPIFNENDLDPAQPNASLPQQPSASGGGNAEADAGAPTQPDGGVLEADAGVLGD